MCVAVLMAFKPVGAVLGYVGTLSCLCQQAHAFDWGCTARAIGAHQQCAPVWSLLPHSCSLHHLSVIVD